MYNHIESIVPFNAIHYYCQTVLLHGLFFYDIFKLSIMLSTYEQEVICQK